MSVAYKTNTAIDYRTYDERVEYEAPAPAVAARPVRRSAIMTRRVLMMTAAVMVAAVCIGLLYLKAQTFGAQRDINNLQKQITAAEQLNSNLNEQYSEATNINAIMDKAAKLGMGYASSEQVLYVPLTGGSKNIEMNNKK
jgi:cell division protein FtsL